MVCRLWRVDDALDVSNRVNLSNYMKKDRVMGVFSKLFSRKPKVTMPSDLYNDFVVDLGASTTLSEIIFIFGEPYWHDDDKDESLASHRG